MLTDHEIRLWCDVYVRIIEANAQRRPGAAPFPPAQHADAAVEQLRKRTCVEAKESATT